MTASPAPWLRPDVCERALGAHDARFDGLFFVGVTTTRVYCRPVCPSRAAASSNRRFFDSAASAERAGFRPCLRCRPELAPGRGGAHCDAVSHLAAMAAQRIAAGALNGHGVTQLAQELGVSERHLRRALEREIGVSPLELAQTHRLLLAKRLLADTALPVTRIAYASGFQSLRRFNSVFREHYRLSPTAVRRPRPRRARPLAPANDFVRLTLAYRVPLAWDVLIARLGAEALPGVETADARYGRTVRLGGETGVVFVANVPAKAHLTVDVSSSLLPVLMPLLARLRHLFDLDAEPLAVDAHLTQGGLGNLVAQRPGIRIPGAIDGFEVALRAVLSQEVSRRVVAELGDAIVTGIASLTRLAPTARRVAAAGAAGLEGAGVSPHRARVLAGIACAIADGNVCLDHGSDVTAARQALLNVDGVGDRLATTIVMRALNWPDAFSPSDAALQRAARAATPAALRARAEQWRPWRAYAALHLGL